MWFRADGVIFKLGWKTAEFMFGEQLIRSIFCANDYALIVYPLMIFRELLLRDVEHIGLSLRLQKTVVFIQPYPRSS